MPGVANGSFETVGASPGLAASWTLTTTAGVHWGLYARADGGSSRFEGFEFSWGADPFVGVLDDTNTEPLVFNAPSLPPEFAEGFEKHWLNDGFLFELPLAEAGEYHNHPSATPATDAFDGFELEWSNTVFFFVLPPTTAGTYNTTLDVFDAFEREWNGNESYISAFSGGDLSAALYTENGIAGPVENFEGVKQDQPFGVTLPSTITCVGHGFTNSDQVKTFSSIYTPGSFLPAPLTFRLKYYVVNATANTLQLALTPGGTPIVMSDAGVGSNFLRADPDFVWTGVDGDTMGDDP